MTSVGCCVVEELLEEGEEVPLVETIGTAGGLLFNGVGEECKPECVALSMEYVDEYSGGASGVGEFVRVVDVGMAFDREQHGSAGVNEYLAPEVGFLFKLFDEELVGTGKEPPVDVARAFAIVVLPVVGEFGGETVEGATMAAGNKTLDDLTCKEV